MIVPGNIFYNLITIFLVSATIFISECRAEEIHLSVTPGLSKAIEIICDTYSQKNRGIKIVRNYASAGRIATQLERGEKTDIVIMMSSKISGMLIDKDLLYDRSVNTFATNRLVVVGQDDVNLRGIHDLASLERIAIGDPAIVASGEYAFQAINRAGLEKELKNRIIKTRDNRESLNLVRSGKAQAAIINKTDLTFSGLDYQSYEISTTLYPRISYIVAMTSHGKSKAHVSMFCKYLLSDDVRKILRTYGLGI